MSWTISSKSLTTDSLLLEESLFSLANGFLGVRGNFEEGYPGQSDTIRGTYINAFHDVVDISYGEKLYGFPSTQQKIVNIIDAQTLEIFLGEDEERFSLFEGEVLEYERNLYLNKGFLERIIHWRSPKGREIKLTFNRLVSFERKELFAIQVRIEPINFFGDVKIISTVNGDVTNYVNENDPRVGSGHAKLLNTLEAKVEQDYVVVMNETSRSNLRTACITSYVMNEGTRKDFIEERIVQTEWKFRLSKQAVIEKRNVYVDTLRHGENLIEQGIILQDGLKNYSFTDFLKEQEQYLNEFWSHANVKIIGDEKVQEGIRFNLYHLLQSAGRDSYSNIAAKGLSGEGYEGHYFWDTEIYMLPIFIMTKPDLAKQLLLYRYSLLDHARERAIEMGHKQGALFPWRTISGGECSPYFPAGTAQYHISADIAYGFVQYYLATGDEEFFHKYVAEVLFETARLWLETGHFKDDQFRIDDVTGPDEYTAIVNNNFYTNVMAKYNLNWAVKAFAKLQAEAPNYFKELNGRLHLEEAEVEMWQKAATKMYLPYDETLEIHAQDDSFLQKAVWDFENTPKDHYPLLLHYHPLTLYRYQVCKQADTVLAHFLLEDEADLDTIKNSYHYYEKITTHDSSLSSCVFSIMGAKIGEMNKAYEYFIETARLDLDNTHGNTKDGLHLANMGGTWMAIVFGFAGLRIKETGISFCPRVPEKWDGYECSLQFKGRDIKLFTNKESVTIQITGEPLEIHIYDKKYTVEEKLSLPVIPNI
ncbi:glycoside hydrolase family 65 protein [Bacillus kwashiorkori]|uniref:glycoside hydrolase family 65 protein n=1 Tax=Bacillus kwashiorkori TaxID=1522318 RepID=UPI00078658FF|nr:glycosyl hydrolase family 65 protein [Bacillus kwashiorkori]